MTISIPLCPEAPPADGRRILCNGAGGGGGGLARCCSSLSIGVLVEAVEEAGYGSPLVSDDGDQSQSRPMPGISDGIAGMLPLRAHRPCPGSSGMGADMLRGIIGREGGWVDSGRKERKRSRVGWSLKLDSLGFPVNLRHLRIRFWLSSALR